jgi:transglutaminase-like putative cysteine protease
MESTIHPPPRLLLGATLLFWGAMSGNAMTGLVVALLIEGANWIRFRWDFDSLVCSRAWRISMLLTLIAGVLIWLDGDRYSALPKLIIWLPLLLLPVQFVQGYGLRDRMPLNSFSFFSELHRERNRRLGLGDSVIHFNFGNPYFIVTAIAASLGDHAQQWIFLPGLVLLGGWLVFSRVKIRPFALVALVLCAGLMGLGGQLGMTKLYKWVTDRSLDGGYPGTDPTANKTSIGSLGRLKQSPEMLWRLKATEGSRAPRLLRLASYNHYKGISWKNQYPKSLAEEFEEEADDFRNFGSRELSPGNTSYPLREKMPSRDLLKPLPSFRLRGAIRSEEPLPLPGNTSSLQRFDLDGIEVNPLGTVRVFPKRSIIEGTVRWSDNRVPESPPWETEDLHVSILEREAVEQVVSDLGLRDLPTTGEKVTAIAGWFIDEFQYTRYLTIAQAQFSKPSAVSIFLTTSKRGHCEYFATAATLLLRAADVPARYCVGYAVMEKDRERDEFVIRGVHGHAWTRVWDEDKATWIDFDPTPPNWLAAETGGADHRLWLADTYQRFKEDFFLWRNRPANRLGATIIMWALGLGVFAFVARRLWRSKLVVGKNASGGPLSPEFMTPLHQLEKRARKILGTRPVGVTFAAWLRGLSGHCVPEAELDEALDLHQQMRFDPAPAPSENVHRLNALACSIATKIKRPPPQQNRHITILF